MKRIAIEDTESLLFCFILFMFTIFSNFEIRIQNQYIIKFRFLHHLINLIHYIEAMNLFECFQNII